MYIKSYCGFLLIFLIFNLIASAQEINTDNNRLKNNFESLLGTKNEGKEFWLTFNPSLESYGGGTGHKIFIYSQYETKVILEIPGKGYTQQIYVYPNQVKEIILDAALAQCYRKTINQRPADEIYYEGKAIHIISDKPVIVFAITKFNEGSDGYVVMPVTAYGKDYTISTWYDVSDNVSYYYPGYVAIISPYDLTTVNFTLGGNPSTKTNTGLVPGGMLRENMFKGDVLLISSSGNMSDLSGSWVSSTKPVVVISSNYYTHIPLNQTSNDLLTDIELPSYQWDNQYLIIPFFNRTHLPVIRVYAKEPNTIVYRDNVIVDTLKKNSFLENDSWLTISDNVTPAKPVLISADKPIYVKQYNRSQDEDGVTGDAFMFSVIPFRQQLNEYTFCTAGAAGSPGFSKYYLNIAYIPDDSGNVPMDFEIGTVSSDTVSWQSLRSYDPAAGVPFSVPINGKNYHSKIINIRQEGVYKIRANQAFPAYIYGTSPNLAYGFPAGQNYLDIEKNDTLPPKPQWEMACDGTVNKAYIEDMPRTNPSKLLEIVLDTAQSYNYNFTYSNFIPGEDSRTRWDAYVIDKTKDARAVITFRDRSGNDTTLTINYIPGNLSIKHELDLGEIPVGRTVDKDFWVINNSDKNSYIIKKFRLRNNKSGFELLPATLPVTVPPKDSVKFTVRFMSAGCGEFEDNIDIGDSCYTASNNNVKAFSYVLTAKPDLDFGNQPVGIYSDMDFFVYNNSNISAELDSISMKFGNLGFVVNSINKKIYLNPSDSVKFSLRFYSTTEGSFNDSVGIVDSCGNYFILACKANSFKVSVQPDIFFDRLEQGNESEQDAWIVNGSDKYTYILDTLVFKNNNMGFEIKGITYPDTIPPTDAVHFYVGFKAAEAGTFTDSIGISAKKLMYYNSEVKADVISSVGESKNDLNSQLKIESVNPNPADGNNIEINIINLSPGANQINIYNGIGDLAAHLLFNNLGKDRFIAKFDTGNLQSGFYYIECVSGKQRARGKLIIIK